MSTRDEAKSPGRQGPEGANLPAGKRPGDGASKAAPGDRPEHDSRLARLEKANVAMTEALRSVEATVLPDNAPTTDPLEACQVLAGKMRDVLPLSELAIFLLPALIDAPASRAAGAPGAGAKPEAASPLPSEESNELQPVLSAPAYRREALSAEFERQVTAGMIGWAVSQKRLTMVPPTKDFCAAENPGTARAVLILPITTPRRVWGIALAFTSQPLEATSENVLRLLRIIGSQAGMTIENAQLHQALARENCDLERAVAERTAELQAKHEEVERAYQEMRRLTAAKDEFLNLVAHELRTPLTGILSFSEFLVDEGLSPQETREFAGNICQQAQRLQALVNDLLDLSRMEAGKMRYRYDHYDCNELLAGCARALGPAAWERHVTVRLELAAVPALACIDRDRMQQVAMNMLSNAIKFSHEGGEVVLRVETDERMIKLSVQDFGLGIAARDIPKVFNKFERIENPKSVAKGTGLGMPIAKNIVEKGHGGKLWVESAGRGKGSTFTVCLPRPPADVASLAETAVAAPARSVP